MKKHRNEITEHYLKQALEIDTRKGKSTFAFLPNNTHLLADAILDVLTRHPMAALDMIEYLNDKKKELVCEKEQRRLDGIEKRKGPRKPRLHLSSGYSLDLLPDDY
jgi:hypothetical protein